MTTTRMAQAAVANAVAAALVLVGCAGASQDEQGASAEEVTAAIDSAQPAMVGVLVFDSGPFGNYDNAYDWLDKGRETIDELDAALPDALDAPDDEQQLYQEMLASLDLWRDELEGIRTELEDRRDEFEPANTAWFEAFSRGEGTTQERADAAGEPPEEYMAVLERNELAAAAWGDACARFVDAADLTADCYAYEAGN